MATKYYAPAAALSPLTLTTQQGSLTRSVMVNNLMRMLTMDRTQEHDRLTAEEAEKAISLLSSAQRRQLQDRATEELNSQEMQEYLNRKGITEGMPLEEVNAEEVDVPEILNEYSMTEFAEMEMPPVEYD
jgi:hypothetical protein